MGFFDTITGGLFGDEPEVKTGTQDVWTRWQKDIGKRLGKELKGGPRQQSYPGELPGAAPLTDLEQQSLAGLEAIFGGDTILSAQQAGLEQMMDIDERSKDIDEHYDEDLLSTQAGQLTQMMDPAARRASLDRYFDTAALGGQQDVLRDIMGGVDRTQEMEDYFRSAVAEPLYEEYEEEIMPAIRREYAPSGFYSGQRLKAEEEAREDLTDALTRSRAELAYRDRQQGIQDALTAAGMLPESLRTGLEGYATQGQLGLEAAGMVPSNLRTGLQRYQTEIDPVLQALGLAPQSFETEVSGLTSALEAGAIPRRREETQIGAEYEEWLRTQQSEYDQWINQLMQALQLRGKEGYATGVPGRTGLVQDALGMAGGIAGGNYLSDLFG
jgi:hypothetical protein